jgi:hypothetical protein
MVEHHRIEQTPNREAAPARAESFSGSDRMSLYHGFDQATGNSRIASNVGGDAGLPTHVTFDNSIYAGTPGFGDNIQKASLKENLGPDAPRTDAQRRVLDQFQNDATKFAFGNKPEVANDAAFGDVHNNAEQAKGKAALKEMVEAAFIKDGKQGLQKVADFLNDRAIDKFGSEAFDKAPPEFDQSVATVSSKENKDGSTQVQFNFAQPNSAEVKSVIFQVPKNEIEKPFSNYFTGAYDEI